MPRLIFGTSVIALRLLCSHAWGVESAPEGLEDALQQEIAAMECPGALVGVSLGNAKPQVFAVGVGDLKAQFPMQRDFQMRIASITKPFVGTAVLLLADDGKLSLDDSISKYLLVVPAGNKITLRQLANNTSGLFNAIENKDFQAAIIADPHRQWSPLEILGFAFAKPAYNSPGAAWRYSNTNAVLLGEVITKAAGTPFAEFVHARVISPLGLRHTGFVPGSSVSPPSPRGYRNGYEDKWLGYGQTFYEVTTYSAAWTGAAGNMMSTVDDLLAAAKPLATGALLSKRSQAELHTWHATTDPTLQYGFCLGNYNKWQGHVGDVPGFASFMGYLAEKDATIVVLTNLSNNKDGTNPAVRLRDVVIKNLGLGKH